MKLTLQTGRIVSLDELHQWRTLPAGPDGDLRMNEARLRELEEAARRYGAKGARPFIVAPSPEVLAAHLPAVTCIAVFTSGALGREAPAAHSAMTFAWWQDDFGAMAAAVERCVREVDWEARAAAWRP